MKDFRIKERSYINYDLWTKEYEYYIQIRKKFLWYKYWTDFWTLQPSFSEMVSSPVWSPTLSGARRKLKRIRQLFN